MQYEYSTRLLRQYENDLRTSNSQNIDIVQRTLTRKSTANLTKIEIDIII